MNPCVHKGSPSDTNDEQTQRLVPPRQSTKQRLRPGVGGPGSQEEEKKWPKRPLKPPFGRSGRGCHRLTKAKQKRVDARMDASAHGEPEVEYANNEQAEIESPRHPGTRRTGPRCSGRDTNLVDCETLHQT